MMYNVFILLICDAGPALLTWLSWVVPPPVPGVVWCRPQSRLFVLN